MIHSLKSEFNSSFLQRKGLITSAWVSGWLVSSFYLLRVSRFAKKKSPLKEGVKTVFVPIYKRYKIIFKKSLVINKYLSLEHRNKLTHTREKENSLERERERVRIIFRREEWRETGKWVADLVGFSFRLWAENQSGPGNPRPWKGKWASEWPCRAWETLVYSVPNYNWTFIYKCWVL